MSKTPTARDAKKMLAHYARADYAKIAQRFFKTGPGEYGEGDVFIGVRVPKVRIVAKAFMSISLKETEILLQSRIHEERLLALIILTLQYKKADVLTQKNIFDFYCAHTEYIHNWDLVDTSAYAIVGAYVYERAANARVLKMFAQSKNMWERRIAIIATLFFIRRGRYSDTLCIADMLMNDTHDLIHKAVGWMLREVGKKDTHVLIEFLQTRYEHMPRTMLRYAIERFPQEERRRYREGRI